MSSGFDGKHLNSSLYADSTELADINHRDVSESLLVLTYHHAGKKSPKFSVGNQSFDLVGLSCDINRFERQMKFAKDNYKIVDLDEASEMIYEGRKIPKNSIAVTFDDGYEYGSLLPVLKKYEIPATFFLNTDMITGKIPPTYKLQFLIGLFGSDNILEEARNLIKERDGGDDIFEKHKEDAEFVYRLERADVRTLKYTIHYTLPARLKKQIIEKMFYDRFSVEDEKNIAGQIFINENDVVDLVDNGMNIGCHSASHYVLTTLDKEDYWAEIVTPKIKLENIIKEKVLTYAYPHGWFTWDPRKREGYAQKSEEIKTFLAGAGYLASFDYRPDFNLETGKIHGDTDLQSMMRIDQASFPEKQL